MAAFVSADRFPFPHLFFFFFFFTISLLGMAASQVEGGCPYDFSSLQNFTSLCNANTETNGFSSRNRNNGGSNSTDNEGEGEVEGGGGNDRYTSSAQILICCEDVYGAAVFALSVHANVTGKMFPTEEEAMECIQAYEEALGSSSPELHLFQRYCPLSPKRITAGASACNFATTSDLDRLLISELGPGTELLTNVSRSCNDLAMIGQRGCQACQTQLLSAIDRLSDITHDKPAACASALAIAMLSLNPNVASFQNFYQCVLEILNGVPITDFLNRSSSAKTSPPSVPSTAALPALTEADSFRSSSNHHKKTLYIIIGISSTVAVVSCVALMGLIILRERNNFDDHYNFSRGLSGCVRVGTLLSSASGRSSETMNILLPTEGFYIFHSKELRKATNNFSQTLKIGEGSAGCVYLGCLPSGKLVAVKKIIKEKKFETFNKEVALLARLRHPNLTALLGYCQSRFAHFLVYEFMGNGDLGRRLLDRNSETLTWNQRVKIAIDCARGLSYLHESHDGPIIHRDIKPSNILLNEALEAKLSDFGLSKVLECEASHVSTEIKGTTGYLDPEYLILGQLTESSDIYSFGVVLLQLLSGRKAIDGDSVLNRSLVQLAFTVMTGDAELTELMDPRLCGQYPIRAVHVMASVAFSCVQARSYDRPSITDVLHDLELADRLSNNHRNGAPGATSPSPQRCLRESNQ